METNRKPDAIFGAVWVCVDLGPLTLWFSFWFAYETKRGKEAHMLPQPLSVFLSWLRVGPKGTPAVALGTHLSQNGDPLLG